MNFPIIQVAFKRCRIYIGCVMALVVFLSGCAITPTPPPQPAVAPLQLRAMQTRTYEKVNTSVAMKAVIAALQDEGYVLANADSELGFIYGAKENYNVDKDTKAMAEFNMGSGSGTYQTTIRLEASATVRKHKDGVKVRINIVEKSVSNSGGNIWSQPVHRAQIYQDIFSKVDKAVFLEKQNM